MEKTSISSDQLAVPAVDAARLLRMSRGQIWKLHTSMRPDLEAAAERAILMVRGDRVMLDADLAELYGVTTKALNQAVRRNERRFPPDFMFRLTKAEKKKVVTNCDHLRRIRFSPVLPHAFTEHGAIMAANILNSERAVEASVYVVRAFVRLRQLLATNAELARRLDALEAKIGRHDEQLLAVIQAIRELMEPPPESPRKWIGYAAEADAD